MGYSSISTEVAWFSRVEICHYLHMPSETWLFFVNSVLFPEKISTNNPAILCRCFVAKVLYLKTCQISKTTLEVCKTLAIHMLLQSVNIDRTPALHFLSPLSLRKGRTKSITTSFSPRAICNLNQ